MKLKLNPLLTPVPDGSDKVHLRWNMLMEPSHIHRSSDLPHVSWSTGRNEPATFPRLSNLKLDSESYPWRIEVQAQDPNIGVTCGEAIEAMATSLAKLTTRAEFDLLPLTQRKKVTETYRFNRSRNPGVPGGMLGTGMKRVDFLGDMPAFGGLEWAGSGLYGMEGPPYVTFRCNKRTASTGEEGGEISG